MSGFSAVVRRVSVVLIAAVLVVSVASGVSSASPARTGLVEPVAAEVELSPEDEAAAEAESSGERVEVESLRTGRSTVWVNPDGTYTQRDYANAIRVKRGGEWLDVDYTLQEQPDGSFVPKASAFDVRVDGGAADEAARVTFEDGRSLAVTWPEPLPDPEVEGGTATFAVSQEMDLVVAISGSGLSTFLRLNERPDGEEDPEFTFGLRAEGVQVDEAAGGGLELVDDDEDVVGGVADLRAWDAQRDAAGDPVEKVSLDAELSTEATSGDVTEHELTVAAPEGFLQDPETEYPVEIDPDVQELNQVRDTWVRQGDTVSQSEDFRLMIGRMATSGNANPAMTFIEFKTPSPSSRILDAKMGLFQYYAESCTDRAFRVAPVADPWTAPSTVYSNRPGIVTMPGQAVVVTANRGLDCAAGAGVTTIDMTNIAKMWASERVQGPGYDNRGVRLAVDSNNASNANFHRRFCSFRPDTTHGTCNTVTREPYMEMTYNRSPFTPTKPQITEGDNPVTVSTGVRDPNAETNLRARIVVKRGSETVFNGFSNSATVGQGETSPTTVRARLPYLPDGDYTVTAQALDDEAGFPSEVSTPTEFTVTSELGAQSWYSTTPHTLNDRSSLQVNNRNGNLVVQASDLDVKGIGMSFGVNRTYNSQLVQMTKDTELRHRTTMGKGWSASVGPDVWLERVSATKYWYHAPGGTVFGPFERNSTNPGAPEYNEFKRGTGGVGANLKQSGSTFTLTFRASQTKYTFDQIGSAGHAFLKTMKDRSDNQVVFNYTSGVTPNGRPKLTSATDTVGRTFTFTYGTETSDANFITQIAGTGRTWTYAYNSAGLLTSHTDADSKVTNYGYTTGTNAATSGTPQLTTITNPNTSSGGSVTTFTYYGDGAGDNAELGNLDRIKDVKYAKDGNGATLDFLWNYDRNSVDSSCDSDSVSYSSRVKDARGKDTTYCYRDITEAGQVRARIKVKDAEGNTKSTSYTPDKGTAQITNPNNENALDGSTVGQYGGGDLSDQLNQVTEPNSGTSARAGTTAMSYPNPDPAFPGQEYQPTEVRGSDGECSAFDYDNKGRTTAAYTGLPGATCDDTNNIGFHREYNDNGTVAESWDANAESKTPSDDQKTIYTYWDSTNKGIDKQLKSIRKPGGSCASGSRKLCTSYTYDSASRVESVTDGRGKVTSYEYDAMDRTLKTKFDGASQCLPATCVAYGYDADGNLTSRIDSAGISTFGYDRLNRQISQVLPNSISFNLIYDGNGNLTEHKQTVSGSTDTVNYEYDKANRLVKVLDATGETNVSVNKDGRVTSIKHPGDDNTRLKVDYDFTAAGKPKRATVKAGTSAQPLRDYEYDYSKKVETKFYNPLGQLDTFDLTIESDQLQMRDIKKKDTAARQIKYKYAEGRLKEATEEGGTDYLYEHDKVGNVTREAAGGTVTHFGYDRAGQLCWSGPDDGSNLATECGSGPSGSVNYSHDAAGNNTNIASNPTVYNARSQATKVDGIDMGYLDQGNDLRESVGSSLLVNSPVGITAKKDGSNITFFTRDPNGTILNAHGAGGTRYYVSEFNASVAAIYSTSNVEVGAYEYSPYGGTTASGSGAAGNPFRYVGGYQDTGGMYKLGARYYDGRGHFTQPDAIAGTITDPKTLTSYNYAGGDPINFADPSGYKPTPGGGCSDVTRRYDTYNQIYCKQPLPSGGNPVGCFFALQAVVGANIVSGVQLATAKTVGALLSGAGIVGSNALIVGGRPAFCD